MSKPTPGPWEVTNSWHRYCHDREPDDEMMSYHSSILAEAPFTENEAGNFEECDKQAVASANGRTEEEMKANALLVACAPDMKERLEDDANAWDQVAAYAEECGETDGPINQIIAIAELQAEKARAAIAKAEGRKS